MNTFLTAGEVATLLRKSTKWVYQNARLIPGGFKLNGSWLWDKEVLVDSLKELAKKPLAPKRKEGRDKHNLL